MNERSAMRLQAEMRLKAELAQRQAGGAQPRNGKPKKPRNQDRPRVGRVPSRVRAFRTGRARACGDSRAWVACRGVRWGSL